MSSEEFQPDSEEQEALAGESAVESGEVINFESILGELGFTGNEEMRSKLAEVMVLHDEGSAATAAAVAGYENLIQAWVAERQGDEGRKAQVAHIILMARCRDLRGVDCSEDLHDAIELAEQYELNNIADAIYAFGMKLFKDEEAV